MSFQTDVADTGLSWQQKSCFDMHHFSLFLLYFFCYLKIIETVFCIGITIAFNHWQQLSHFMSLVVISLLVLP